MPDKAVAIYLAVLQETSFQVQVYSTVGPKMHTDWLSFRYRIIDVFKTMKWSEDITLQCQGADFRYLKLRRNISKENHQSVNKMLICQQDKQDFKWFWEMDLIHNNSAEEFVKYKFI